MHIFICICLFIFDGRGSTPLTGLCDLRIHTIPETSKTKAPSPI